MASLGCLPSLEKQRFMHPAVVPHGAEDCMLTSFAGTKMMQKMSPGDYGPDMEVPPFPARDGI